MFEHFLRIRADRGGLLGLVVAAALPLGILLAPSPASAQIFDGGWSEAPPLKQQQTQNKQTQKKKKAQFRKPALAAERSAKPDKAKKQDVVTVPKPDGPLILTVSLKAQSVRVYDARGLFAEAPISSGRVGNPTPTGVFTILEKEKMHYSNLYGGAPMPNMNRITWSGVALHAGVLPGYPASHGCIRLPHAFSAQLYGITKVGNRVVVARDTLEPRSIADAGLFTAFPDVNQPVTTASVSAAGNAVRVADASGTSVPQAAGEGQGTAVTAATGTGAAMPAGTAPSEAAPVNPYRAKWQAEMERRAAAIPEAEARKVAAAAAAPLAGKAADDAKEALKKARADADRAANDMRKTARDLAAADAALKAFVKRMTTDRKLTEQAAAKMAETEDQLEGRITELTKALEVATAEETRTAGLLKDAEAAASAAEVARKQAAKAFLDADAALKAAIESDASAKRRDKKRQLPISVFVSLKTKKIYVRQGYEPVFEGPVAIADPEKPIGTHIFTAMTAKDDRTVFDWTVVSVPTVPAEKAESKKQKKKDKEREATVAAVLPASYAAEEQTAEKALARIEIPADVREIVADSLRPSSSLLVSDHGLSSEFGEFTDFTVALR